MKHYVVIREIVNYVGEFEKVVSVGHSVKEAQDIMKNDFMYFFKQYGYKEEQINENLHWEIKDNYAYLWGSYKNKLFGDNYCWTIHKV